MIDVQHDLSPILSALLLKEFSPRQVSEWAATTPLDAEGERIAMTRFFTGLEEHRLDLRSDGSCENFCEIVLGYLEALLDPGTSLFIKSGIESTASSATTVWAQMSDSQKTILWQEAKALHAVIAPLAAK